MVDISRLTSGVNLPAAYSGKIFAKTAEESAFLRAAGIQNLKGTGEIVHSFGDSEAFIVGETEVKTLSNPAINNTVITPKKFVVANLFSDEIVEDAPELVNAIRGFAPSAIARKVDSTIASSATIAGFATLGGLTATEVADDSDFESIFTSLDGKDFGVVLSNAMLGYLRTLRGVNGARLFEIDGTTINGFDYFVYRSAVAEGFVADWKENAVAGRTGDIRFKVQNQGNWGDVNLNTQNMIAVVTEARIGFGVKPGVNTVAKISAPAA